jgi:hypothetical protein
MAVILLAGGALIAKYIYQPQPSAPVLRTVVPSPSNPRVVGGPTADDPAARAILAAAADPDLPDGAHWALDGGFMFKAGDAYLKFKLENDGPPTRITFGYFTLSDEEWDHGFLTQGVRRLLLRDDFARRLALTDQQAKRLADLPPAPPSRLPDADRDRFLALFREFDLRRDDVQARGEHARAAAEAKLVKALADYATTTRASNQKRMADRVAAIRSILTEAQLARINPIPRWELPASRPTPASSPSTPGRVPHDPSRP